MFSYSSLMENSLVYNMIALLQSDIDINLFNIFLICQLKLFAVTLK